MRITKGFTLIELMVTVAVLAILVAIALPAMGSFLARQQVSGQANDLSLAMALARSEAVKTNTETVVLPVTATNAGWGDGWCVGPASISNCSANTVIRTFSKSGNTAIVSANVGAPPKITFRRDGTRGPSSGTPVFKVSSSKAPDARCVRINPQGRTHMNIIATGTAC